MKFKNLLMTLLLTLGVVALVACGGAEPTPAPAPTEAPAEEVAEEETVEEEEAMEEEPAEEVAEEEAMEEEAMEEEMAPSIAEIAVENGSFTTLVAALDAAGLVETLSGEGTFTVFAPTDDAFAALPEGTVEGLLEDPEGALTNVLLYHVVGSVAMAEAVVGLESVTTLQGEGISIEVTDSGVVLNGAVNVVTTDIEASNGVIHVIDAVLLPPSMTAESDEEMADEEMVEEGEMTEEMAEPTMSIAEIAVADGSFTTLVAALDAAGLVETLSGEGTFTVFAPTDDAFAALPEGTVEGLLEDPEGALTNVLLYHVVGNVAMAADVAPLDSVMTLQGEEVTITSTNNGVILNDTVNIVVTDIAATNGVIHVIDAVLLPPSMTAESDEEMAEEMAEPTMSIAEIAVADGSFTTLVAALDAAGLVETLSGEGEFTVFAPTDDAFAALPEGTVEGLLEDPEGALTNVLLYHVVGSVAMAEAVVGLEGVTTLQGEDVTIEVIDGGVVLNGSVNVTATDIKATNGVIHVIDAVLLPPSMTESADQEMMEEEMAEPTMSIAEIAVADGSFTTLVAALDAAGLVETLSGEGSFTVFAPTDDAFAALPEGTVDSLLEDPAEALTDILLYHVVDGVAMAEAVVGLDSVTTLQGSDVSIEVVDGGVVLNGEVMVVMTDIMATNGVIHVIDTVLLPPAE